jgi:O-acetylhomoserine (thiol)-lyase
MRLETQCLHAGYSPDPTTNACAVPLYRTSSFVFDNTEHAANLFALKELGNIYSRIMNPTQDVLEQRVAQLEGGAAALAVASGTMGVFFSVINVAKAGDNIVSANNLYGGTYTQFNDILPNLGITTKFVDPNVPANFATAIDENTKALFCESVSNPGLAISDIEAIAKIAHDHGIPLIVDSTFSTPYLERPIEHGADIVVHSLTKWMGGHGTGIGGIVVDSGKFNWANGGCISPDNAWMFLQGIETLPLRMERHCSNSRAVAKHLDGKAGVDWVRYPGLRDDGTRGLVDKYLSGKGGSMVIFGIEGGAAAGSKFIDSLELFSHLANVGDAKSLAIHPATTTHSQLSEEAQIAGGIAPELVRLSVGIEHIDDIIADIDQALEKALA